MEDLLKKEPVKKVQEFITKFDSRLNVSALDTTARTAKDAAASLKCEIGAIKVMGGHLECLKYAHENGCCLPVGQQCVNRPCIHTPWDENTCSGAACYGHLDCLKYAHENGCHWNNNTYLCAAYNGHLDCLQYARDNGCCLPVGNNV